MKKFIADDEFNRLYNEVNNLVDAAYGLDAGNPLMDKIIDRMRQIHERLGAKRAPEYILGVVDGGKAKQ